MKFGKEFRIHLEETLPEWRDKYLRYKPLKKLLKTLPSDPSFNPPDDERGGGNPPPPSPDFFIGLLNQELEKFNDFYVDQEEDFVIFFQVSSCLAFISTFNYWKIIAQRIKI